MTILVAVSGGPDSVAVLRAMHRLRRSGEGRMGVLHFNHQLRGAASDADEAFVVQLCQQLGVPCEVGRTEASGSGTSDEGSARASRYEFFRASAERQGSRFIVTGHTADDQVETIVHRIIRGTGLVGLAGIPRQRMLSEAVTVVRPLLSVSRTQVLAYLQQLGQGYRTDASNCETRYTRNRLRHELLPLLQRDYNPGIGQALLRLGELAREAQEVLRDDIESVIRRAVLERRSHRIDFDVDALRGCRPYLMREAFACVWREQQWPLREMGYVEWQRLAALVESASGAIVLPGGICATRIATTLTISRPTDD